jgi:hypothetical protein
MFPFLSFHAIAASRGDGLRPELLAGFNRLAAAAEADLTLAKSGRCRSESHVEPLPDRLALEGVVVPEDEARDPSGL